MTHNLLGFSREDVSNYTEHLHFLLYTLFYNRYRNTKTRMSISLPWSHNSPAYPRSHRHPKPCGYRKESFSLLHVPFPQGFSIHLSSGKK